MAMVMSWFGDSRVAELREAASDEELIRFVGDSYPRLIRLAAVVCRDPSEAEDAVQAALERMWRSRGTLRDQQRLRPWMDRIVVREAIRLGRRRTGFVGRLFSPPSEIEVGPPGHGGTEATAVSSRVDLRIAYEALPVAQRAVVALHLYAGYSVEETANLIGVPVETARSRLRLAREKLRAQLREVVP